MITINYEQNFLYKKALTINRFFAICLLQLRLILYDFYFNDK